MAGAIDLFSGARSITGTNLMKVNKSPLDQIDEGIEDVVGKQAGGTADQVTGLVGSLVQGILGLGPDVIGTLSDVLMYFGNLETFLGELNPLDPNFDPLAAAETFIETILNPTNILANLVPHGGDSAGLTGFIPLENLALDLIEGAIGGAQDLIDAILGFAGFPAGSGTVAEVDLLFANLSGMLGGLTGITSGSFNPLSALTDFITNPGGLLSTGLLAGLDPFTGLLDLLNIPGLPAGQITSGTFLSGLIPGLDATHIISGQFPISMITNLPSQLASLLSLSTWQSFIDGTLGTAGGTGTLTGLTSFINGLLPTGTFQNMIDTVLGGSSNPLSAFTGFLTGTHTTANNANSNATSALSQLSGFATGLLGSGNTILDVVPFLSGLESGLTSTTGLAGSLESTLNSIFSGATGIPGAGSTDFLGFLDGLLGGSSPLNALNIFGLVQPGNLSQVGIGQIGSTVVNLLTNPNFQGTGALDGGGIWSQDPTVGYGGTLGSAKVTATGATRELLSNSVAVTQGQTISLSGRAQWASVAQVAGKQPIQIAINAYLAGAGVSQTVVNSVAASPATSSWQLLSGSYTVPSGVDSIRMKLVVSSDATAGTVWFTNLNLSKTGLLPTGLVGGLDGLLGGHTSDIASLFTSITTLTPLTMFNSFLGIFGGSNSSASSLISSFLTGSSTINAGQIGGTGTIADTFVPGVVSVVDNIVTNLLGLTGSGFSHSQANTALANTAASLIAAQASIATLNTTLTAGVSAGDTFTTNGTSSTNLGANWLSILSPTGHGHWGTPAGNAASWVANVLDATTIESINIWQGTNAQSVTDNQTATVILSNTAGNFLGSTGYNDIWLRVSSASTSLANVTGIRFRWGANGSVKITRFVNGVSADLNSAPAGTVTAPGSGTNLTAYAGKAGTARWFDMHINNTSVLFVTEVGSGSQLGAGFRGWGWGGRSEGLLIIPPLQEAPATIHQWNAADQPAA